MSGFAAAGPSLAASSVDEDVRFVDRVLESARQRLSMDVAMIARVEADEHEVAAITGEAGSFGTDLGGCVAAGEMYCSMVVDAGAPIVVTDAANDPRVASMPVTSAADVGAYVGVPLLGSGGDSYGTLCCLSHDDGTRLGERDVQYLSVLADVISGHLDSVETRRRARREAADSVAAVLAAPERIRSVFQPIVRLADRTPAGYEALTRFTGPPDHFPDQWFAAAHRSGLGLELELRTLGVAVEAAMALPPDVYLSVNASPALLTSGQILPIAERIGPERLVVEVTEHSAVEAYDELLAHLFRLRRLGIRLAVDDAGSGYASFRHILSLSPDVIKLDMALVRGIHEDAGRRSLAGALVGFAREVGAVLVAEGVEVEEEAAVLVDLGAEYAQGYLFGRPAPLPARQD